MSAARLRAAAGGCRRLPYGSVACCCGLLQAGLRASGSAGLAWQRHTGRLLLLYNFFSLLCCGLYVSSWRTRVEGTCSVRRVRNSSGRSTVEHSEHGPPHVTPGTWGPLCNSTAVERRGTTPVCSVSPPWAWRPRCCMYLCTRVLLIDFEAGYIADRGDSCTAVTEGCGMRAAHREKKGLYRRDDNAQILSER